MVFNSKSKISIVSHNKADIQRKTVLGYLEETMETKDDLGSGVLKKPLSSLESNIHRKEACFVFQPILRVLFYWRGYEFSFVNFKTF